MKLGGLLRESHGEEILLDLVMGLAGYCLSLVHDNNQNGARMGRPG